MNRSDILADVLHRKIVIGEIAKLPGTVDLCMTYSVSSALLTTTLRELHNRGLITKEPVEPGSGRAARWVLAVPAPPEMNIYQARAIAREILRRVETGWYYYTGLDGRVYRRPFPTAEQLMSQFQCTRSTLNEAFSILRQLGYLTTAVT